MIIRKPTRIQLKAEEDLCEYEEFRRNQIESSRAVRREERDFRVMKSRFVQELSDSLYRDREGEFIRPGQSLSLAQSFTLEPQPALPIPGAPQAGPRPESIHINQLFSMLLNNIQASESPSHAGQPPRIQ